MMHGWNGAWPMSWMWVGWLLGLVLVVAVVVILVRAASTGSGGASDRESPEEILKRRFARGEIDEDEYQKRLRALRE